MTQKKLIRSDWLPYHVVNQVNNRDWFPLPSPEVWRIFSNQCYEISTICGARIHAFVLMSNHFHMIVSCPELDLGRVMQHFSGSGTRSVNTKAGRNGHLFRGRYKWSLIRSALYYSHALKYVYRNPVKAGLSLQVEDYPYSSLYGLLGQAHLPFPIFPAPEPFYLALIPKDLTRYLEWLNMSPSEDRSKAIRLALRRREFQFPRSLKPKDAAVILPLESGLY